MSNTTGRKWGIPKTNPRERYIEPGSSNQKMITKYTAPKARKRDVAKTTKNKNKNDLK